ncbi:DUF3991 and TOPRIM domain-containing protein [Paenibacillus radicis (ex Xue et al. 2023)]|uniref:DUF3991 and toprim domain-containing protein n=1 Tax=Paenibacillus radicis (ex Xue et al. 2023) TaxID=2972489 RepID=A0ABT1YNS2_9BACL|nr:DUF3991 and TOPRIM domain-containing protein [Paenibacillus radicis (ex Xue et al. 2023)]MCR8633928.1 DUF3991 and toprim domain-containing protein [Paenibacillus radicis (ex Xue et al. 2023)]
MRISDDNIQKARMTNLIEFCERNGYELKPERNGDHKVVGYAGLVIKDNFYYRHSEEKGGNALDFCIRILGMNFKEAVEALIEVNSVVEDVECDRLRQSQAKQEKKGVFMLPKRAAANTVLYPYLCKVRKIPMKIVKRMIEKGLVYQDDNYNYVFPCFDNIGGAKGAILRGTHDDNVFKGRAANSDVSYGWVIESDEYCNAVTVVEAPIDAMSLLALYPERAGKNYLLALGGLHLEAIKMFLKENKQIAKVVLALDNDDPVKEFVEKVKIDLGQIYEINVLVPVYGKDWNEMLEQERTA